MDKIARIRQEIDKRYAEYRAKMKTDDFTYYEGMADALDLFEQYLDTLTEEPDKSLEEASYDAVCRIFGCDPMYFGNKAETTARECDYLFRAGAEWQASQMPMPEDTVLFNKGVAEGRRLEREDMMKDSVTVECYVRVYPTLDDKPRPWVALYKHGIGCNSLRDIPELENIGFKDNDTAIVIIKRKEDGQ